MERPFNGTMAGWGVLGNLAEGIGLGAEGFFKTQRMIEQDLEQKRMNAMKMRAMEMDMANAKAAESRAASTYSRNLEKESAQAKLAQAQAAFNNRQFDAAKLLVDDYNKSYNNLFNANRVGAKYAQTPMVQNGPNGKMVAVNPDMTPASPSIDWNNPFNLRALGEQAGIQPGQTQIMQMGGGGLMSVTPSIVPGQDPEIRIVRQPQAVLEPKDRFQVVGNSLIDLMTGKLVYQDPTGGSGGGVAGALNGIKAQLIEAQINNLTADNARADQAARTNVLLAKQDAMTRAYNAAIAAGQDPNVAAAAADQAGARFDQIFPAVRSAGAPAGGAAAAPSGRPGVRGRTPRAVALGGTAPAPQPTPAPGPRGASARAQMLAR